MPAWKKLQGEKGIYFYKTGGAAGFTRQARTIAGNARRSAFRQLQKESALRGSGRRAVDQPYAPAVFRRGRPGLSAFRSGGTQEIHPGQGRGREHHPPGHLPQKGVLVRLHIPAAASHKIRALFRHHNVAVELALNKVRAIRARASAEGLSSAQPITHPPVVF